MKYEKKKSRLFFMICFSSFHTFFVILKVNKLHFFKLEFFKIKFFKRTHLGTHIDHHQI